MRRQEDSTAISSQHTERDETRTPAEHDSLVYTQRNAVTSIPPDLNVTPLGISIARRRFIHPVRKKPLFRY